MADEGNFDIVVVGSRGMSMLGRLLQGSVSEHATHTRASVIIVK